MQPRSQGLSSPHPRGSEGRKTLVQAGHVAPKRWEGDVTKSQYCLSITHYGILVESQHELKGEISKTPKKIYSASINATSSCKHCKSVGDFLTLRICLEKQIVYCDLPLKRFTLVSSREVNYFCIYAANHAKDVLKTS